MSGVRYSSRQTAQSPERHPILQVPPARQAPTILYRRTRKESVSQTNKSRAPGQLGSRLGGAGSEPVRKTPVPDLMRAQVDQ